MSACAQPACKTFIKGEGGVDQYPGCTVKYIGGHNPDLLLKDATSGELVERIDLTQYKTQEALHEVFTAKGIPKVAAADTATKAEL